MTSFKPSQGFTLIELIVVLMILGTVAGIAGPRFFARQQFDAFGLAEDVRAALRYAQKSAIAKRRTVCVNIAANTLTLTYATHYAGACDRALVDPADGAATSYTRAAPSGLSLTSAVFSFDSQGRPSAAQTLQITGGDSVITIEVKNETGYVQ